MTALEHAATIAARCQQARRIGDRWQCLCPSHDDTQASLSITAQGEKVLLHCHAGCDTRIILADLGLSERDLFASRTSQAEAPKRRIVKTYDYHDVDGYLLFQTVRYQPKDFRQRRPDPARPGEYLPNLQGVELILYRLPDVLTAVQQGTNVYLVEGEKDADNLHTLGLTATTAPLGAGKWRESYAETLRGADVIILPDNDAPGRKHAELVARSLHSAARSVKVVTLPELPEKGDISDWLQADGTREQLEALVAACPLWPPASTGQASTIPGATRQLRVTSLATVMPERVHWLWKPYLPLVIY